MTRPDQLEALRLKVHRIQPPRPIRDARVAAAFVGERKIVMTEGRSSLPALTEAIAGRRLTGSWMSHPEVHHIYRVWMGLDRYDFIDARLVMGKIALMVPSLGPAVERIAADAERRERARRDLPPIARRLLDDVESEGKVRMDGWGVPNNRARPARMLLERELLVTSEGLHTERGYHTSIVRPWSTSEMSKRFRKEARALTLEDAKRELALAAVRSAVVVPEKEARRWFCFEAPIEHLVEEGVLERLPDGRLALAQSRRARTSAEPQM